MRNNLAFYIYKGAGNLPKRDYKKEYAQFHGKPEQIKNRAKRNKARRVMGLKVGDKREVDHIKPLKKGGSNTKNNLRVVSRTTNRKKGSLYSIFI